jgi:ABC-type amino acid transport substrate-binding protein
MNFINICSGLVLCLVTAMAQASEVKVLGAESMPFCGAVDGRPAGMAVEILNAATREGGPGFSFDFAIPWPRAQAQIHEQTHLAIIPFTRTDEREANYKWIVELFPSRFHLVTVGRAESLKNVDEARDLEVGVLNGSAVISTMTKLGFTKIQAVANDDINVRKISAGRLDAWVVSQYVGKYLSTKIGQDSSKLQYGAEVGDEVHVFIAADPAFPDSDAQSIRNGVERVRASGELLRILQKYR